ncbi:hypothetical protein [Kluyvera ascorbata]|uniref:hypothetical protein n=1 Tax=Kluyvera ascorbata TaxID=51288 RepID=UPI000E02E694|nr:hypothetical protein [Kluyvera ascorbata]STW98409.1 Uncharacterised protein [Kluyvera ascorbata]
MTDITAQAQRMKAAALKAKSEANEWGYDTDAFHDEATPDAVIQVVEDLEASRAENKLWALQVTKRNGEIYGLEQRIAELESRTVTVKLPLAVSVGGQGYREQVVDILAAAGIQVIEGEGQ